MLVQIDYEVVGRDATEREMVEVGTQKRVEAFTVDGLFDQA